MILILLVLTNALNNCYAQSTREDSPLEASLAKAYLYLISRTTWPAEYNSRLNFCINRDHSLYSTFAKILPTFSIKGTTLSMLSFDESDIQTQQSCAVIALSDNRSFNQRIIRQVADTPVLTISHDQDITADGGSVYLAHGRKLEPPKINITELSRHGLKMDASVIQLSLRRWGER